MKVEKVIAPSIYQMENGSFRVVARVGDRKTAPSQKEKRFPSNTALRKMKAWQEDARAELTNSTFTCGRCAPRRMTGASPRRSIRDRISGSSLRRPPERTPHDSWRRGIDGPTVAAGA